MGGQSGHKPAAELCNLNESNMSALKTKRSLGAHPLVSPAPSFLIGSYDATGKPNVMAAAWAGICCSKPLSIAVAIRPERWSHDAILARKAFTVGHAPVSLMAEADFVGMASGRDRDKFAEAKLTAVRAEKVDAPYADECPVVLECVLLKAVELGAHTLMIGEIVDVKADEDCLDAMGKVPDFSKVDALIYDPASQGYYRVGERVGKAFAAGEPLFSNKK